MKDGKSSNPDRSGSQAAAAVDCTGDSADPKDIATFPQEFEKPTVVMESLHSYSTDTPHFDHPHTARLTHRGAAARMRFEEKLRLMLPWTYQFGVVDSQIFSMLDGMSLRTSEQTLRQLSGRGLLRRVHVPGTPVVPYMLTPAGARWVQAEMTEDGLVHVRPWVFESAVPLQSVEHTLLTQIAAIRIARRFGPGTHLVVSQITGERILQARGQTIPQARKLPDAVVDIGGQRIAIEVQETRERELTRERILTTYLDAIADEQIAGVVWCSTRPGILADYQNLKPNRGAWWYDSVERRWRATIDYGQRVFRDYGFHIGQIWTLDLSDLRRRYYR